jgi:hypothetical protein
MANAVKHVSQEITAGTTEGNVAIDVKKFNLIVNDSANTLTLNFDNATTDSNAIILKSGEKIENLEVPCYTLYHKASGSSSKFRIIAIRR